MKKITQIIFATLCIALSLSTLSCSNLDNEQNYLGGITVSLIASKEIQEIYFKGIEVKLTNVVDASVYTNTSNENGIISFSNLTAGTYNLSVISEKYSGNMNDIPVTSGKITEVEVQLNEIKYNESLVIKEVFYSGEHPNYDIAGATLLKDHFIELFNNSSQVIYLDGICIADIWTGATADAESAPTIPFLQDPSIDHNFVYSDAVIRIPGSGKDHPLEPGKSFLIATNAINFKEELRQASIEMGMEELLKPDMISHIIDLSNADMETYAVDFLLAQGREGNTTFDLDNPAVPNMENVYFGEYKDFFFFDMTGAAPVIFKEKKPLDKTDIIKYTYQCKNNSVKSEISLMKIPVEWVIDGADFVNNAESARWKRLPSVIDSGFGYIPNDEGSLTNFSQRRKIDTAKSAQIGRCILKDTNNTTNDFEPLDPPTPKAGMDI